MKRALAIVLGAGLLTWPAVMNGYPLVFVDTARYLTHVPDGAPSWDKTAAYGLLLHLFHGSLTLWLPMAAQGLLASSILWLTQRVAVGFATASRHLAICAGLALLTTAPWFTALLMPDALTPWVVLCLYLLGFGEARLARREMLFVAALASVAIATHLSHLPTALGLVLLTLLLRRRIAPMIRVAMPVAAAVLFLLAANLVDHGRPVISAHGSVFLFARLQADGPATETLRRHCPDRGWQFCDALDYFPADAEAFLWGFGSPVNATRQGNLREAGSARLAREAAEIVALTLRERPLAVARAMAMNTLGQLVTLRLGDVLGDRLLEAAVGDGLGRLFPAAEVARFESAAQVRGRLEAMATPFSAVQAPVLGAALIAILFTLMRKERHDLLVMTLAALLGNAFATGALSGVHDRYQARIAWLLPFALAITVLSSRSRRA